MLRRRSAIPILASLLLALPLSSCKRPRYPSCRQDSHCRGERGNVCVDQLCHECRVDGDCRHRGEELVCIELRCDVPEAASTDPLAGAIDDADPGIAEAH